MCKVMIIAGIKPEHLNKVQKLVAAAAKTMSIIEDDGVGYAAITKDGAIYGEKWLNKDDAFQMHAQPPIDPVVAWMKGLIGDMGEWSKTEVAETIYQSFGIRNQRAVNETVALILHARKATSGSKSIENVHPFALIDNEDHPDTAIIHNGSIANHLKLTKTMSTCDSEVILHQYLENMMYHNPWGIERVAKTLKGEYAVGALSSTTNDAGYQQPILDIFKSGKELHAGYVVELETLVFCTSEYSLETACRDANLTVKNIVKIKEGFLIRLDAVTGQRIDDLISFTLSDKTDYSGYRPQPGATNFHRMAPHSALPNGLQKVGPHTNPTTGDDDITETADDMTVDAAKKHFERRHPSLFTVKYLEVNGPLAENEKALFNELSQGAHTNHKALHLVAVALASVAGKG